MTDHRNEHTMTDQECAAVLWEYIDYAIERAIDLSEREAALAECERLRGTDPIAVNIPIREVDETECEEMLAAASSARTRYRRERNEARAALQELRDTPTGHYHDEWRKAVAERDAALAEIERLRAALERVDASTYYLPHINEAVSDSTAAEVREEANAILDAIVAERPVWGDR